MNETLTLSENENKIIKEELAELRKLCADKYIYLTNDDSKDYNLLDRAIMQLKHAVRNDQLIIW